MGQAAQRAAAGNAVHYERRRPEETALYQLVQEHAESFSAHIEAETGANLPQFVKEEFDAFLDCGILAHGFLRLRCGDCGHEKLVAFSCKRRGFLPLVRGAAHGRDCRPLGRSCHPARAGAPMGVVVSDPTAHLVRRSPATAHPGVAGDPPRHYRLSVVQRRQHAFVPHASLCP